MKNEEVKNHHSPFPILHCSIVITECRKKLPEDGKKRNRSCEMSDSEIMTILLLFHFGTFKNFKHYYRHYNGTQVNCTRKFNLSGNLFEKKKVIEKKIIFVS